MNRIFAATSVSAFDWPDADDSYIHSHHRSMEGAVSAIVGRVRSLHPALTSEQEAQIRSDFAEQGIAFRLDLRDRGGDALTGDVRDEVDEVLFVEPIDLLD